MIPIPTSSRYLFFTGKGGVGKTALACATAISLADEGKRVLLVSTDPASNLDEMLGLGLSSLPTDVTGVPGLAALNIDPEEAAEAYRRRVVGPYVGTKSADEIRQMTEQLSGACTTEIASFDRFAELLGGGGGGEAYDRVVFDTAPTGHTLRLLELPSAWTDFLEGNEHGASCLGPHSGLTQQRDCFARALRALVDPQQTCVVLVTRPNGTALREAERSSKEMLTLGIENQVLVVNAVFHATDRSDMVAAAFERRGESAMEAMPAGLRGLRRYEVPLKPFDMVGLEALRAVWNESDAPPAKPEEPSGNAELPCLRSIVDELAGSDHGLVMVMGKGGVGKTTIAAAIAMELSARGIPVHLTTTDPAAHLEATVRSAVHDVELSRIDPARETERYVASVLERRGAGLDAEHLALLREDLRSPCTEEVAVFHAFSRIVSESRSRWVVLDTAPTGHTLLLLDATGAYHRDVMRGRAASDQARLVTPLMRLRDPSLTKVIIVTLAEPTPVTEAAQLQSDLRRAGIEPFAWVINASLSATGARDPLLKQKMVAERAQIRRVCRDQASRVAVVPWSAEEPVGRERLRALMGPERAWAAERSSVAGGG